MKSQFLRHCSSGNDGEWPLSDGEGAGRVLWSLDLLPGEPREFLSCGNRSVGPWRLKPPRFAGQSVWGQRASQRGSTPAEGHSWVLSCVLTSSCMRGNYRRSGWAHPQKDQSSQCPVLALAGQNAWLHQPGWRPSLHKVLGEATEGSFISRNSYLERGHNSRPNTFLKQDQKDQTFFQVP